ncbi:MAG: VCBS repeat-containing protein [Acidobacteriales bacterium]|nr:VCBS repeat-containing protein [Terriglobales bacterium]
MDSLTIADFNLDGNLDLALGADTPNNILLFEGNGDGTFQSPIATPSQDYFYVLKSVDLNGDGIPDLAGLSNAGTSVFIGKGGGTFQPEVLYRSSFPSYLAIGDFNRDGKPDFAIGKSTTTLALLLNNGDGTFGQEQDYFFGGNDAVTGDFNQDGFPDVASISTSESSVSPLSVLLNTGK